ncbi:class I SAM-dependent methyltransferase [Nonomuraea jabiensis]|uniref:class I SAM-dependent methyltransferase n=1 Tax=Nonomuraea jabiensis TaxID=882448 RepID=UPI0036800D9C
MTGRRLLHLQCHFGLDTLSWARLGAEVTGLDFSEAAIEQARDIAAGCGVPAEFVTADVYDAVASRRGRPGSRSCTRCGPRHRPDLPGHCPALPQQRLNAGNRKIQSREVSSISQEGRRVGPAVLDQGPGGA